MRCGDRLYGRQAEGRFLLNKLATFYCLPYLDVGVRLEANGQGEIDQVCGSVNYLQPDGSSLLSRRVITMEQVVSEGEPKRTNPEAYSSQVEAKYIRGVQEEPHLPWPVSICTTGACSYWNC